MASNFREVNLELGKPTADEAIRRLTFELHHSKATGVKVLKIIHGYGSSGVGGKIRIEARRYLEGLKRRGQIKDYLTGEQFSIFDEPTRSSLPSATRCAATATSNGTTTA
jgi:hypothetical protein